jgi:hypothetical protein
MGGLTIIQHLHEIRGERQTRNELLKKAMAPYMITGHEDHQVGVRDANGRLVFTTLSGPSPEPQEAFEATVEVVSPALAGGRGTVTVWEDAAQYNAELSGKWRGWWVHMAVTLLTILFFILVVVNHLVSRPLERLLDSVRKMEMGYWGDVEIPGGAWEIRWLALRFRNMGVELHNTVQQFLAAERRAIAGSYSTPASVTPGALLEEPKAGPDQVEHNLEACYRRLDRGYQLLESLGPGDSDSKGLAHEVWNEYAIEAERLGDPELKARLEDAALRILEPAAFNLLEEEITQLKSSLRLWVERHESELCRLLESEDTPYISVNHRIKHTAGVWRKMKSKGLTLKQVHDLIAFRIVTPTEPDCYQALGVIHRTFEPLVGRFSDYISTPKANGYQSLHTCVRGGEGPVFEIQIRSVAMDRHADKGEAAHWVYKKNSSVVYPSSLGLIGLLRRGWSYIRRGWISTFTIIPPYRVLGHAPGKPSSLFTGDNPTSVSHLEGHASSAVGED